MKYSSEQVAQLSIAQLKNLRRQGPKTAKHASTPALTTQARPSVLPLSYGQERLWFLEQLGLVGPAHNTGMALRLEGAPDIPALERSIAEVIRRHETLRTRFERIADRPAQVVDRPAPFALEVEDISALDAAEQARWVEQLGRDQAQRTFNLTRAPLLHAQLLRLAPRRHVLLITIHHIVFDGWSWQVLHRELSELYAAFSQRQASPLTELPLQYADFAIWQRQLSQAERLQEQLGYWKERLRGAPPLLELPTDRVRPAVPSFKGARLPFELPSPSVAALKVLARAQGATLFMVVLSAYQLLLARYSGQRDIVVGSPVAGRHTPELEGLIGFFINLLPLRIEVDDAQTFRELLGRVKDITLSAYAYQELPFEKLIEELRPERSLARQPLIQATIAFQNYPEARVDFPGLTGTWTPLESGTSHFDLTLYVYDHAGGLSGTFEYATDLFDAVTIERFSSGLRVLLEGIAADPECPVGRLPLLDTRQRDRLLWEFNQTVAPYPEQQLLHELVEAQAGRNPNALALICGEQRLTYAHLNARANRIAHMLRSEGVGPDQRVAVCADRSAETIVALLAILKAGGAYVPLDMTYPKQRLQFMLADSSPIVLLSPRRFVDSLPETSAAVHVIDPPAEAADLHVENTRNLPRARLAPEHLAYIIYTSGSTGMPKGVLIGHRNVVNLVNWHGRTFALGLGSRCSCMAALGFDATVWEIWGTLAAGATLLIPTNEVAADMRALLTWWSEQTLDLSFMPTPMAELALAEKYRNASLRVLLVGGDRLRYQPTDETFRLLNNYGPTEITVAATSGDIPIGEKVLHIGRPIDNTRIYVLDRYGQPVPIGAVGEIHIGGAGVARGYLNHPELTAERFVPDPFSDQADARLYKTGDLARWRNDGTIDYVGRNDDQVKIRGYRIETGEIETHVLGLSQVKEAVIVAREDAAGVKRLIAYVVAETHQATPTQIAGEDAAGRALRAQLIASLREHLSRSLPEHMVPTGWVFLERLPLTANGKLNRQVLPAPRERSDELGEKVTPRNALEHTLAHIWAEVLGVEEFGVHDNFFTLGGHSLLATQVVSRVQAELGLDVSTRMLFECPTVEQLARGLERLQPSVGEFESPDDMQELLESIAVMPDSMVKQLLRERRMEGRS